MTSTLRWQFGGDEVVKAKDDAGSTTLSMAYAEYSLAETLLKAAAGHNVTRCTFLNLDSSIKGDSEAKKLLNNLDLFFFPVTLSKVPVILSKVPVTLSKTGC